MVGLVPAAVALVLAFGARSARFVLIVVGLILFLSDYLSDYDSGPDNPLSIIPVLGLCVTIVAVLVEVILRAMSLLERGQQRA